jgi:hypothetical protein
MDVSHSLSEVGKRRSGLEMLRLVHSLGWLELLTALKPFKDFKYLKELDVASTFKFFTSRLSGRVIGGILV